MLVANLRGNAWDCRTGNTTASGMRDDGLRRLDGMRVSKCYISAFKYFLLLTLSLSPFLEYE